MPKLEPKHPLKVFLCHASQDKPAVRELYQRLKKEGWIDPWLDEEKLTLGQHWTSAIEDALDVADIIVIFLSKNSVQKEGFVQRELNYAWEISLEKPRNAIFLIPFRLDNCEVPRILRTRQWGDYFGETKESTYQILLRSLKERQQQLAQHGKKELNYGSDEINESDKPDNIQKLAIKPFFALNDKEEWQKHPEQTRQSETINTHRGLDKQVMIVMIAFAGILLTIFLYFGSSLIRSWLIPNPTLTQTLTITPDTPIAPIQGLFVNTRTECACEGKNIVARLIIEPLNGRSPYLLPGYDFVISQTISANLGDVLHLTIWSSDNPPLSWTGDVLIECNPMPVCN